MQRRLTLALWCVGLACGLGGCTTVTTIKPLPLTVTAEDQQRFEGTWLVNDDTVSLRFDDSGVGQIAGLDWDEEAGLFRLQRCELYLTAAEHARFISMRCLEKGEWEEAYLFLRYHFTPDDHLVLWMPRPPAFRKAVEEGLLQGRFHGEETDSSVTITGDPETLLALIDVADDSAFFEYHEPLVLRKLEEP